MAEGRGSVGGSKCSVVVAVERAVVSVSPLLSKNIEAVVVMGSNPLEKESTAFAS